jgi:hypothetical protein
MPTIQGLVDYAGKKIRQQGAFMVVNKSPTNLIVRVPGQVLTRAFVLATPWRDDGDIGVANTGIAASPNPAAPDQMIFAVDQYYGVSFRIQT